MRISERPKKTWPRLRSGLKELQKGMTVDLRTKTFVGLFWSLLPAFVCMTWGVERVGEKWGDSEWNLQSPAIACFKILYIRQYICGEIR